MPSVSVVMSVHNGFPFLSDAVASILGQTFGDFEVVIVDDGSTDNTSQLIEKWQKKKILCSFRCQKSTVFQLLIR